MELRLPRALELNRAVPGDLVTGLRPLTYDELA